MMTPKHVGEYYVYSCVIRYLFNKLDLYIFLVELHIVETHGTVSKGLQRVCNPFACILW